MPNPSDYSNQEDFMGACVPKMMKDKGMANDQAVATCMNMWRNKALPMKDAPPGHEFYGNQFSGGGGEGGDSPSGGGGGGRGWASPHDEFRFVQRRLAAGHLKRGEKRMLERRSEKLAKQVLGVNG